MHCTIGKKRPPPPAQQCGPLQHPRPKVGHRAKERGRTKRLMSGSVGNRSHKPPINLFVATASIVQGEEEEQNPSESVRHINLGPEVQIVMGHAPSQPAGARLPAAHPPPSSGPLAWGSPCQSRVGFSHSLTALLEFLFSR